MSSLGSFFLFLVVIFLPLLLLFLTPNWRDFNVNKGLKSLKPARQYLSDQNQYENSHLNPRQEMKEYKYILTWCEAYGGLKYGWDFGPTKFSGAGCEESRCFLTSNRSLLGSVSMFDAIMFHQRSFSWKDAPLAEERRPGQRYVHWMFESPAHLNFDIVPLNQLNNYFNWTMSYRLDSTFPAPYGSYQNIAPHPKDAGLTNWLTKYGKSNIKLAAKERSKDTALIAWFVSNCNSKSGRESAVKELKKYIPVDVYGSGSCSDPGLSCPRSKDAECLQMLNTTYKFYLSLENSMCSDYVTEKLWKVLSYNVIPVVLNGADMSSIAPPHSVIQFSDFKTIADLAKYLKKVAEDDLLFASYFWWRDFYTINTHQQTYQKAYCSMCAALHDSSRGREVITDIKKHWTDDAKCWKV